jgi:uncharacterized membrane protein YeaQ/YmgE (transglycosylase-associated protein family)
MNLTALIIQLISGAVGGNAAGAVSKNTSLGPIGDSIVGALGGGVGGQILSSVLGMGARQRPRASISELLYQGS